jgi:3'(2'), 5'-bisphosphate nucleotidase
MFYKKYFFIEYMINLIKKCNQICINMYNEHLNNENITLDDVQYTDKKLYDVIIDELSILNSVINIDILIISESTNDMAYEKRKGYEWCWIIDSLDGTKEYMKKNGQFTINIGLVKNGIPMYGIVSVPVQNDIYYGGDGIGSYKISETDNSKTNLNVFYDKKDKITIVTSNSNLNNETEDYIKKNYDKCNYEIISVGSTLKFLMIADGRADLYPKLGKASEWDTCAAHAVVKYAGGKVFEYGTNKELVYNKENLSSPWFIVSK